MSFGVVTYKEAVQATNVELKTANGGNYQPMLTNPLYIDNPAILQGRALSVGVHDAAIYLNGELATNLFNIERGSDYLTFLYIGSSEFIKRKFLFEINLF